MRSTRSTRVIGVYYAPEGRQVGFARAVSDETSVAYLADVYVLRDFRQLGLGLELVREMVESAFEERALDAAHGRCAAALQPRSASPRVSRRTC